MGNDFVEADAGARLLSSLTDLVTGTARLTVSIINGLVALLNQTLGWLF